MSNQLVSRSSLNEVKSTLNAWNNLSTAITTGNFNTGTIKDGIKVLSSSYRLGLKIGKWIKRKTRKNKHGSKRTLANKVASDLALLKDVGLTITNPNLIGNAASGAWLGKAVDTVKDIGKICKVVTNNVISHEEATKAIVKVGEMFEIPPDAVSDSIAPVSVWDGVDSSLAHPTLSPQDIETKTVSVYNGIKLLSKVPVCVGNSFTQSNSDIGYCGTTWTAPFASVANRAFKLIRAPDGPLSNTHAGILNGIAKYQLMDTNAGTTLHTNAMIVLPSLRRDGTHFTRTAVSVADYAFRMSYITNVDLTDSVAPYVIQAGIFRISQDASNWVNVSWFNFATGAWQAMPVFDTYNDLRQGSGGYGVQVSYDISNVPCTHVCGLMFFVNAFVEGAAQQLSAIKTIHSQGIFEATATSTQRLKEDASSLPVSYCANGVWYTASVGETFLDLIAKNAGSEIQGLPFGTFQTALSNVLAREGFSLTSAALYVLLICGLYEQDPSFRYTITQRGMSVNPQSLVTWLQGKLNGLSGIQAFAYAINQLKTIAGTNNASDLRSFITAHGHIASPYFAATNTAITDIN